MNAQAVPEDLDALFGQMMDHLESMLELCSGADRDEQVAVIKQRSRDVAALAQKMLECRAT